MRWDAALVLMAACGACAAQSAAAPTSSSDDVAGLAQGALIVERPEALENGHAADYLFDEDPHSTWVTPEGKATNQVIVVELPERCNISRIEFDESDIGLDTHSPKDVLVELSDTAPTSGFKPLAKVKLKEQNVDGQSFAADAALAGRWLRITVLTNYGGPITEIAEFRAFGKRLSQTPSPDVSGSYDTASGWLRLKQQGTTVTGCYEHGIAPLVGGIEGRVVKFEYQAEVERGPGILVFSPDGKRVLGAYWNTKTVEDHPRANLFPGTRSAAAAGACPQTKAPDAVLAQELAEHKRLRLYGVNFDSDSATLREESKPALELVVKLLKAHADWKLTVEGHTDATAAAAHNQTLSEQRAAAVKAYLVAGGIDAARLSSAGFGATKPIAPNDNALGRAANRRVELTRP